MSTNSDQRKSLLTFWTTRYLITLCIGLLVIGILTSMWIKYSETQKRLDIMRFMAAEISDRIVDSQGHLQIGPFLPRIFERRQPFFQPDYKPMVLILDDQKRLLFKMPGNLPEDFWLNTVSTLPDTDSVTQIQLRHGDQFYVVNHKIEYNSKTVGSVILLSPEDQITKNPTELRLLFIMLGSLGLLGWIVIYLLTRKLSNPIKDVANAAKQIVEGNYDIQLNKNIKEREIYELIQSFKDMTDRLRQLELMRTELLAGVTHELKTPVTSISGLVQAVKDEVVTGEDAKEFLDICTKETSRLQKMVEDLLDFNSFSVGDIRIHKETLNINHLIQEIVHQWKIAQEENGLTISVQVPNHNLIADTDPLRVQQIIYNLLNNAKHALRQNGTITLVLTELDQSIILDVSDNGTGIPTSEQPLVFERFFRGEGKKHKVRGLGLGLPFSRLMAQALGGNLLLQRSSESGTTFRLVMTK